MLSHKFNVDGLMFFKYTHPTSRPITTNIKVRHLFILDRILCQRIKFKIIHALCTSPNLFNETIGFFSIVILIEINTQMKCYKVGFVLKISSEFPLWTWNRSRHMVILFIVIFAFTSQNCMHFFDEFFLWIFRCRLSLVDWSNFGAILDHFWND